jgi:hypothetical protein
MCSLASICSSWWATDTTLLRVKPFGISPYNMLRATISVAKDQAFSYVPSSLLVTITDRWTLRITAPCSFATSANTSFHPRRHEHSRLRSKAKHTKATARPKCKPLGQGEGTVATLDSYWVYRIAPFESPSVYWLSWPRGLVLYPFPQEHIETILENDHDHLLANPYLLTSHDLFPTHFVLYPLQLRQSGCKTY